MTDFFLDDRGRLSDEERALMAAMLRGLVADIADELIAALPSMVGAQAERVREGLYRRLRQSGLMKREGLVALLLRRADEQQLSARTDRNLDLSLAPLVGDDDPAVADAAMALTLARGRRRDRFGRLGVEFDDLPAEDAVALVQAVAAALRDKLDAEADQPLQSAAQALLARHDEGRRLEASVAALVRALEVSSRANDEMVRHAAQDGDAALLVGLLARRAGLDLLDAWNLFASADAMMVVRLAGCDRATAAQIVASLNTMFGAAAPDRIIDRFDAIDDDSADGIRRWMRLDPHYRAAREALERANG